MDILSLLSAIPAVAGIVLFIVLGIVALELVILFRRRHQPATVSIAPLTHVDSTSMSIPTASFSADDTTTLKDESSGQSSTISSQPSDPIPTNQPSPIDPAQPATPPPPLPTIDQSPIPPVQPETPAPSETNPLSSFAPVPDVSIPSSAKDATPPPSSSEIGTFGPGATTSPTPARSAFSTADAGGPSAPSETTPEVSKKRRINKRVIAAVFIILMLTGIPAAVFLSQQQQDIRQRAVGILSKSGLCDDNGCTCVADGESGATCPGADNKCYIVDQSCPNGVVGFNACTQNAVRTDASDGGNGSVHVGFTKTCGVEQIDMGCESASGIETKGYVSKDHGTCQTINTTVNITANTTTGGGCSHCELVDTCAAKGGTWNGVGSGGCSGAGFGNCTNLPPSQCQAPPPPVCKPEGVVNEKLWCDGNSIPSNESLCQGIDCCYGECTVFNTDDGGQCGKPGCNYPQCGKKVATCGGPPKATATPKPTAQCLNVLVYDTDWTQITDLTTITPGQTIRFVVKGSASQGIFDKARFTVNGTLRAERTQTRQGTTDEFYDEYVVPDDTTDFSIKGEIHHSTLDKWF